MERMGCEDDRVGRLCQSEKLSTGRSNPGADEGKAWGLHVGLQCQPRMLPQRVEVDLGKPLLRQPHVVG